MLFDKPVYFIFLFLVVLAYWRLPRRAQNGFLLLSSYVFYGWWDWRFLSLIAGSTVVDYCLATRIARSDHGAQRRALLVLSLAMNFGFLGFFKYCNFFIDSFAHVTALIGFHHIPVRLLAIILPPGISFYTFQAVAYIVDVYQGKLKPAQSLVDYALFISLFPHLIAGPIQRPSHLLPQVAVPRTIDHSKVFDGLMLIVMGLFRKCVIADNCALLANAAFDGGFGPPSIVVVLIGVYAFAWQIYGDFSGYSDIARGSAQLLGFHFMVNFRQPYLATSLQDFWRRWHVSLSTWLRDYLYIPLGGNRRGETRTYVNLLATMLLGGLWHGANWTFVLWGAMHGTGLALGRFLGRPGASPIGSRGSGVGGRGSGVGQWAARIAVFHFVALGWLFFRADSVSAAFKMLAGCSVLAWRAEYATAILFLTLFSAPLALLDLRMERCDEEYPFEKIGRITRNPSALTNVAAPGTTRGLRRRIAVALCAALLVALFAGSQPNAFIYFRF